MLLTFFTELVCPYGEEMDTIIDDDFLENFDVDVPSNTNLNKLTDGTKVTLYKNDKIIIMPTKYQSFRLIKLSIYVKMVESVKVTFIKRNGNGGTTSNTQEIPVPDSEGVALMQLPEYGLENVIKIIIRFKATWTTFMVSDLWIKVCVPPVTTSPVLTTTTTPGMSFSFCLNIFEF